MLTQEATKLLLQKIADGDEHAFAELYNLYWKKTFLYLVNMTKSREIAEELLLDIFTKLWVGRILSPKINDLDAFLSKVAYHKAIDFFRFAAKEKKIQQLIAWELGQRQQASADELLLDNENKTLLLKAISKLSPKRKLIFTLSREQGLTHHQIARQLEISPHTVKKTMSEAIKAIRDHLSQYDLEYIICLLISLSLVF